jgi:hypothetical protein
VCLVPSYRQRLDGGQASDGLVRVISSVVMNIHQEGVREPKDVDVGAKILGGLVRCLRTSVWYM